MRELFLQPQFPMNDRANSADSKSEEPQTETEPKENPLRMFQLAHTIDYLSDMSDDDADIDDCNVDDDARNTDSDTIDSKAKAPIQRTHQPGPPPLKRKKLEVSYRDQRNRKCIEHMASLATALKDIDHLIKSKKTKYLSGPQGLQARRTLAI